MKLKVTEKIIGYDNKSVFLDKDVEATYLLVFSMALNNTAKDESLTAEVKSKCFQLSTKLHTNKEVDLDLDERSLIKERVNIIFNSPLICGRVSEALEGK